MLVFGSFSSFGKASPAEDYAPQTANADTYARNKTRLLRSGGGGGQEETNLYNFKDSRDGRRNPI